MSTSDLSYKAYSFADHKVVYLILEETFKAFGVHYYLIGANARDVQLYKAGGKPNRGTADIDFAVMLPDIKTYNDLKNQLKEKGFADAVGNLPYRLYYEASNTVVDLLPYGEIAQKYTVSFTERELELSVIGLEEVGLETENFEHPEGFTMHVTPAHGIVILKLISWSEKPDRTKDLQDIKALLEVAWNLYEDEFFKESSIYSDLFNEPNFDTHLAAARVMGRKMQVVLNLNAQLKQLIVNEIQKELGDHAGLKSQQMVWGTNQTIEEIRNIFNALYKGLNDQ